MAGSANADQHAAFCRVASNDLRQTRALSDFVCNELELGRGATVHDCDPYTSTLMEAFANANSGLGGEVPAKAEIENGETDMTDLLEEVAAAGPDATFVPWFLTQGSAVAAQARTFAGLDGTT